MPLDCRQKAILPRRGRIAFSANERIAEFLGFAIQAEFAYVNKLRVVMPLAFLLYGELREIARVSKTLCFADFGGDEGRLSLLFGEEISHSRIPRHNR